MARWRQSFVFARETEFGKGQDGKDMLGFWYVPPPNSIFSSTYNRETQRVNQIGQRAWKDTAYGKVSGSWNWTFVLDYDFMEPFMFVFDSYKFSRAIIDGQISDKYGCHEFKRTDMGVTPSFCVRRKTLHRVAGGEFDEIDELYGCVCTSFNITSSAGNSQITVSLSGVYADEYMGTAITDYDNGGTGVGKLDGTDYVQKRLNPVEFASVQIGGEDIADVQSVSIQSKNSVQLIHSILNPISRSYWEGTTSNAFSCTIYSKDPRTFRQRVYTGGATKGNTTKYNKIAPIPEITLASSMKNQTHIAENSKFEVNIKEIVVKSMGWSIDDGALLKDKLESADSKEISLRVINKIPYQYNLCKNSDLSYNREPQDIVSPILVATTDEESHEWVAENAKTHLILSTDYTA